MWRLRNGEASFGYFPDKLCCVCVRLELAGQAMVLFLALINASISASRRSRHDLMVFYVAAELFTCTNG